MTNFNVSVRALAGVGTGQASSEMAFALDHGQAERVCTLGKWRDRAGWKVQGVDGTTGQPKKTFR